MWWLCGHGALTAQVVTPPVAEVMAQVSGVLSLSIMPVCVLLFLMECARVWREKSRRAGVYKSAAEETVCRHRGFNDRHSAGRLCNRPAGTGHGKIRVSGGVPPVR